MQNLEELIKKYKIDLKHQPLQEEHISKSNYLIIRHAYSEYNFNAQRIREEHGEESQEFKKLISDPSHHDPGLHEIGIKQAECNQEHVNKINFKVVFVSPLQRTLQTAIHLFKAHPNKVKIKFMVTPIIREVLETSNDIAQNIDQIIEKYSPNQEICQGIKFDFSLMYSYGQPQMWQIYTLVNVDKQSSLLNDIKEDSNGMTNHKEVLLSKMMESLPFEKNKDLFERGKVIKKFLREYLQQNPLDVKNKEKYCIISHSRIIATLTALGVNPEDDSLIEYVWFKNCEMKKYYQLIMGCKFCTQTHPNLPQPQHSSKQRILSNKQVSILQNGNEQDQNIKIDNINSNLEIQNDDTLKQLISKQGSKIVLYQDINMKDIRNVSFSQRRYIGFRKRYEFDQKRILICNKKSIKVFAYKNSEFQTIYNQVRHQQSLFQQNSILCCSNSIQGTPSYDNNMTLQTDNFKGQDQQSDYHSQNLRLICQWNLHLQAKDEIIYAGFLEDINPNYIIIIIRNQKNHYSKIYLASILKLQQQAKHHQHLYNDDEELDLSRLQSGQSEEAEDIYKKRIQKQLTENPKVFRIRKHKLDENYEIKLDKRGMRKVFSNEKTKITNQYYQEKELLKINQIYKPHHNSNQGGIVRNNSIGLQSRTSNERKSKTQKYQLKLLKLGEFKGALFNQVFYSHSNIYGKIMFTTEQQNKLRVHIFKDFDENRNEKDNDDIFSDITNDFMTSRKMKLNNQYFDQETGQDSSNKSLDPIKKIETFGDYIIIVYEGKTFFDICNKSGNLIERKQLQVEQSDIQEIEHCILPRLLWSDRYVDIVQQSQNELSKKLIISGILAYNKYNTDMETFQNQARQSTRTKQFILIYDRIRNKPIVTKLFEQDQHITCINYGPYDNGHLIVGFENGMVQVYNSIDLTLINELQLFQNPIQSITFDPINLIIICSNSGELVGLNLIENKVKYLYVDIGQRKYFTVQMPLKHYTQINNQTISKPNIDNEQAELKI